MRRGLGRVLVAEDDREVRDALAEMLDANGYEVVGRAETGRRAIELTTSTEPDVVLLDYRMPSGDGITVTQAIRKETPATQVIMLTAFVAQAILAETSLSFLGLGVQEPTAAWGLMLSGNAADFYRQAPWMILFPGVAISIAVFAFNLFGDSLRDYLDPRFKV